MPKQNVNGIPASLISLVIPNDVDTLSELLSFVKNNIVALSLTPIVNNHLNIEFVVETQDTPAVTASLERKGLTVQVREVFGVTLTNEPNALLNEVISPLAARGVTVTNLLSGTPIQDNHPRVFVGLSSPRNGLSVLRSIPLPSTVKTLITA